VKQTVKQLAKHLARAFWVALALVFLFEAWLWDSLAPIVRRIVGVIPWGRIKPAFVSLVQGLSPRATLVVFAIPFVVLAPVKLVEFWLFAHRYWFAAIGVLLMTKVVGLGLTAFIFEATQEKLLQMLWFRRLYEFFVWARAWAHDRTEPVKRQMLAWAHTAAEPVLTLVARWRHVGPGHDLIGRIWRLRRRMRPN
jgi:hypothetical protein